MLTAEQKALREDKITASFAPWLIAGDEVKILDKWRELVGDPRWQPPDFSNNWAMALGSHVETLALDWRERKTGNEIIRRGEVVFHPTRPFVCATLDGYRAADHTVLDAKWIDARANLDDRLVFYTPQLIVQRACVPGAEYGALVAVHGGGEPQELIANITDGYADQVWERIDLFQHCVATLTPPVALPPVPPPPSKWRKIDLDADGAQYNWAATMREQLALWSDTADAAKANAAAAAEAKKLLPDDCSELAVGRVLMTRNRARAVSIRSQPR